MDLWVYSDCLKLLTVKAEEAHFGFCCRIIPSNLEKADLLILVGFLWWSFLQDINTLNCKKQINKDKCKQTKIGQEIIVFTENTFYLFIQQMFYLGMCYVLYIWSLEK